MYAKDLPTETYLIRTAGGTGCGQHLPGSAKEAGCDWLTSTGWQVLGEGNALFVRFRLSQDLHRACRFLPQRRRSAYANMM